jgi:hypothetical protein
LRNEPGDDFSSVGVFKNFHTERQLVSPEDVLDPVISFLDADDPPAFSEVQFEVGQTAQ